MKKKIKQTSTTLYRLFTVDYKVLRALGSFQQFWEFVKPQKTMTKHVYMYFNVGNGLIVKDILLGYRICIAIFKPLLHGYRR